MFTPNYLFFSVFLSFFLKAKSSESENEIFDLGANILVRELKLDSTKLKYNGSIRLASTSLTRE